jgi:hypothetical protein
LDLKDHRVNKVNPALRVRLALKDRRENLVKTVSLMVILMGEKPIVFMVGLVQ